MYHALIEAYEDRWTHADELLALILEVLDRMDAHFMMAWGDKTTARRAGKHRPYRYRRPADRRPKGHRRATIHEIIAFFRG